MLSFIEIASQLSQEPVLSKFRHIAAAATLRNIGSALAQALQKVLIFNAQIETAVTGHGQTIFREDQTYYYLEGSNKYVFNPFNGSDLPGTDIYCDDNPHLRYSKEFLDKVWMSLDFVHVVNPLMHVMVADFLTVSLNEEQLWAKNHSKLQTHVMQNYVDLERLLENYAPDMGMQYYQMLQNVELTKQDFILELTEGKTAEQAMITAASAEAIYKARGGEVIEKLIQGFWDLPEIQQALDEIRIILERIVTSQFPTIRLMAERSTHPAYGYDVFHVVVLGETELVVRTLGDYRILQWELNKE
jgi:hypothetical protein